VRPGGSSGGVRVDGERGDALFDALGFFILDRQHGPDPHIPRGETAASCQRCSRLDASGDLLRSSAITQVLSPSFARWTSDTQPFL
jgi:hypothetical protein